MGIISGTGGEMDIRILPGNIANMIAAGEVVQRPASVVKELMENAVDAGATRISVVVKDAGRTLIQVIDNGCGMSPDEAVLCFERHATSKISTADDLMNLQTFGFRGEALASIAAVAEVMLKTRREEDEVGCEVAVAASQHLSTHVVAIPVGTNFAVRNLFYNVPARRKFLKPDNVELKHIVAEFKRVAITRPEIAFSLTHNDKDIFVLNTAMSMKFRIQDLLGSSVTDEVVDIYAETSVVTLSGFIGRPDHARKGLGNQYLFVNGRFFKSPYLHKAVMKGYENLVPEGVTPTYFIFLDVDPHSIDVNISPTKTEIKFEDDNIIFQTIAACIKETLGRNSFGQSIDFEREGAPEIPVFSRSFENSHPVSEPRIAVDPTYNPFDNDGFPSETDFFNRPFREAAPAMESVPDAPRQYDTGQYVDKRDDYGKLFEDKTLPSRSVVVCQGRYVFTSVKSGLMVVDIRRAKERIFYERFMKAISQNAHVTQAALFPVTVHVGVENVLLFEEHSEMLSSAGFDITPFGNDTVVVNGVPEGYSVEPGRVQVMVSDLVVALSDDHSSVPEAMQSSMAERLARLGATSDDNRITAVEAQRLIDLLFACENAEYTVSGHKTMTIIPMDDVDKMFR